ncbi:MAG TPA: ATP-dependent dethiobiotin synthetase BioD [Puia sp.]|nr:ATP-dependent dethiobiotin synthetase BioD [Puia sp.]
MQPIFITGIGTDIGKTVVAAIITEALQAAYWKPVQAGFKDGTDSEWIAERITHPHGRILPETYRLSLPASPHIAARQEGVQISLDEIGRHYGKINRGLSTTGFGQAPSLASPSGSSQSPEAQAVATPASVSASSVGSAAPDFLVIEGAGGLMVPLNGQEFVLDLIKKLDATVILVSRNYLGSINHSLLTASVCKAHGLKVAGWIFNDQYLHYEEEIVKWSGLPALASIPHYENPDTEFIRRQAGLVRASLTAALSTMSPAH